MRAAPAAAWRMLIEDGATAAEQMAIDLRLAQEAVPTFRLFGWSRPACSLGFRQPAPAWIDRRAFADRGIELIERPTGGGLAVHGSDLSCSVVAPREAGPGPSEILEALGETMVRALDRFGVSARWDAGTPGGGRIAHCLTDASPYAVMVGPRKTCGFALRRLPQSWLVQGSLLARRLPAAFNRAMPAPVRAQFDARATSVEQAAGAEISDEELRQTVQAAWQTVGMGADAV